MQPSSDRTIRGFSLIEVLVVVAALGMIVFMAAQLFFPMRRVADRQRLQVESRQTARSAADYVAFLLRGTADLNSYTTDPAPRNTAAVLTYLFKGDAAAFTSYPVCPDDAGCIQVSYNNVAAAGGNGLADPGTDIITVTRLTRPQVLQAITWGGHNNGAETYFGFDGDCSNAIANRDAFFAAVGTDPANAALSKPMVVFDSAGNWQFYQIDVSASKADGTKNTWSCIPTDPLLPAACDTNPDAAVTTKAPCVWVTARPGVDVLNAPGGPKALGPGVHLAMGVDFVSVRVCQGWLEIKDGIFDPTVDTNCPNWDVTQPVGPYQSHGAAWTPLMSNVEDLQIVYLFSNGQVRNSAAHELTADSVSTVPTCLTVATGLLPAGVPCQTSGTVAYDVSRVLGFRVTVTGRSSIEVFGEGKALQPPLVAEDHDPAATAGRVPDLFYRSQVSADALIRNRSTRR